MADVWDIVVIGGGPAGFTAGLYSVRSGKKTLLIEKELFGGQVALTNLVENYPGVASVSGQELMNRFKEQAEKAGLKVELRSAKSIKQKGKHKEIETDEGLVEAKAVIIATGSSPRKLGVKGEKELEGKGVHYCALCDGPLYKDKEIAVVGGGDSAVKEALFLAGIGKRVWVIHRRDALRADKANQEKAFASKKIEFVWDSVVEGFEGKDRLEKLKVKHLKSGDVSGLAVDAAFIYVGLDPNTGFVEVEKDERGLIVVDGHMATSVKGIFAAGDCIQKSLRQITTCVGEGSIAATSAAEYVDGLEKG